MSERTENSIEKDSNGTRPTEELLASDSLEFDDTENSLLCFFFFTLFHLSVLFLQFNRIATFSALSFLLLFI